ncbi:helix-turn-helix transcriptional regulator [Elizabethkingia anophelis]|nr:helix-turn-helix transcriptional regulator [Elizabethkingia anophelis]MDE5482773.1 helix-turn-helix domain-containing protein [Elizabethkingia meningoseptica]MCT3633683.1 helix-turn-helix transcriptional regulator [Elizabethkingia anophelis]MCT3672555.1 helix-turn-helix transcriptional regulator [Elizabethkingia anophelis]MCT3680354.1 helix-turn-helix transcriptional regulator [Elizabethkingia anophelis]
MVDKKEFQIAIGKRIQQLRKSKGYSQAELAALCNFEKSNMSRLEAGNTNPTAYTLYIIAQKLNIEIHELLIF